MAIYKSNKKVVAVYKGSTPYNKIYKGVTLVFQKSGGSQSVPVVITFTDKSDPTKRQYKPLCEGTTKTATSQTIELPSEGETYKFVNNGTLLEVRNYSNNCPSVTSFKSLFSYANNMKTLTFAQGMDTSKIKSMFYMFEGCGSLVSIDLSSFNTSNCTDFCGVFANCRSLVSIDLSSFNTSNSTTFNNMFGNCSSLGSLDLSNFETSNSTAFSAMFKGCRSLGSLDLSNFETSNSTTFYGMFEGCSSLGSLDLSNFETSKVTSYNDMFKNCTSLSTIKCKQAFKDWCITNQDTILLPTAMREGGSGTWEITHLIEGTAKGNFDLTVNGNSISITTDADGKWFYDTNEKITSLNSAFSYQTVVTSVDLSNLDLTGISTSSMFEETNVTSIKFNNTKSMKLVEVGNMFFNCSLLTSLDLSSFNTSNLQNANSLFCGCTSLETLDLSNFDLSKATSYFDIFRDCDKLTHIKCKQAFKDWCITNQGMISLPTAMIEGGSGTWEIVA